MIKVKRFECPVLPPARGETVQPGLAGPVSGASGNYVIVAGGSNFENGMPWRGGKKIYHDEIYLMKQTVTGSFSWEQASQRLPLPLAYPACLTIETGVLSLGGETPQGPVSGVFLISVNRGEVALTSLPPLPEATTSAGAAFIGTTVFVAGGITLKGATSSFYSFNLQNKTNGWRVLPELPLALSHAVVVSQSDGEEDCIYVIGGRNRTGEVSTFYSAVWKYKPSVQKWNSEGDIQSEGKALGLSAGTGIAAGSEHIVLFGGDPGIYFNRTERMNNAIEKATGEEKQRLLIAKDEMLSNHPGFSKEILSYNTRTKKWENTGTSASELPVTTSAFAYEGKVVLPLGEVRPGVRTPKVPGFEVTIEK